VKIPLTPALSLREKAGVRAESQLQNAKQMHFFRQFIYCHRLVI